MANCVDVSPSPQFLAASYSRLSENDGTKTGIPQQQRLIRKRAERDGVTVAYELTDDDRSAYKTTTVRRDGYQRLLELMRKERIKFVLVKHADRLHRSVREAEEFIELAREHGVTVITASGIRYLLDTADGEQAFAGAAVQARFESRHRGERVAESHEERALLGRYRGGARRPFGWGVVSERTKPDSDLTEQFLDCSQHNAAEAAEIRRWKDDLLAGVSLAEVLRSIRLPTVAGGTWDSRTVRQILTNPRTSGHSVYRGEIVKRNAWPHILTDDEREALKAVFADPKRKTSPGNVPKWLGSLIYLCGRCDDGTPMTCRYANGGQRVYRCQVKNHCQHDAERLDAYVRQCLWQRLSRDDLRDLMPDQRPEVDRVALRAEETRLEAKKREATQRYLNDEIDGEQLAEITAHIKQRLADITAELSEAAGSSPLADFEEAATIEEARKIWEGLSLGRQREILKTLFEVTALPIGRGRRPKGQEFNPATVRIRPILPKQKTDKSRVSDMSR